MIADKLLQKIKEAGNPCVIGLDTDLSRIPPFLGKDTDAIRRFNFEIIDATSDLVPAVKIQIAFYEKHGSEGIKVFHETLKYAKKKGLIVITDGKRNDISSTADAYSCAHFKTFGCDFLTVNPYLGTDGLLPFISPEQGTFILVKTSNPSSGDFQDRMVELNEKEKKILKTDKAELHKVVALKVNELAQQNLGSSGYSSVGAVVGATYPEEAKVLRKLMPNSIFLVPGYGAQGGRAKDLLPCFNSDGLGAVINNSRGIICAWQRGDEKQYANAARDATEKMIEEVSGVLEKNK